MNLYLIFQSEFSFTFPPAPATTLMVNSQKCEFLLRTARSNERQEARSKCRRSQNFTSSISRAPTSVLLVTHKHWHSSPSLTAQRCKWLFYIDIDNISFNLRRLLWSKSHKWASTLYSYVFLGKNINFYSNI